MRRLIYIFILLCCTKAAIAQGTDSVVQYRLIDASFTEKSKSTTDKRHYEYIQMRMRAGDVALIEYLSSDFVTALMVRDSLGHQGIKEDDTTLFKALGSKIILPFKAPADGPYYFVFMTRLPGKTGKFKAHIFHYNAHNNHISNNSSFCEKIKYIAGNSYTGFEFLKAAEQKGGSFEPSVTLLAGAANLISHDLGDSYTCSLPSTKDLAGMKKKFDELEQSMSTCLTDHTKKVYTQETIPEFEKKSFVKKVEFTLVGTYSRDLNATHALGGVKDIVILRLDKDGTGQYHLRIEVD